MNNNMTFNYPLNAIQLCIDSKYSDDLIKGFLLRFYSRVTSTVIHNLQQRYTLIRFILIRTKQDGTNLHFNLSTDNPHNPPKTLFP